MRNYISEKTIWKVVDGHWTNIEREFVLRDRKITTTSVYDLATYLWLLGFDIPETIIYCLAQNESTGQKIKFRQFGGKITIYARPL